MTEPKKRKPEVLVTFRASRHFHETVKKAARDRNLSLSYLIRLALAHELDDPSLLEGDPTPRKITAAGR